MLPLKVSYCLRAFLRILLALFGSSLLDEDLASLSLGLLLELELLELELLSLELDLDFLSCLDFLSFCDCLSFFAFLLFFLFLSFSEPFFLYQSRGLLPMARRI
jgi:hypothetical protein